MFSLLAPKTKTKEEIEAINAAGTVREEKEYFNSFGTVPTKEQRNDWFRCGVSGPQMKHGNGTK
jgi:hypothetical protein